MISHYRTHEVPRFLHPQPVRRFDEGPFFYPVLRQGLYQYLENAGLRSVLLPEYVPQGIHDPFLRHGFEIRYYRVDANLGLDARELEAALARRPDVFVYIHYFGVYHAGNMHMLQGLVPEGTLFIEDFAHTLPHGTLRRAGDVSAFSFTKLIGVPEGSLLTVENPRWARNGAYGPETPATKVLRERLTRHLWFDAQKARRLANRYVRAGVRRFLGERCEYYPHLMVHYPDMRAPVSRSSAELLNRVDFDRVFEQRRRLAAVYCRELDERLKLELDDACFTEQALLAFPIRVPDQLEFHRHLMRGGVEGYFLVDRWWFLDRRHDELLEHHYLLPLNHHLTESDVSEAAERANRFLARKRVPRPQAAA